MAKIKHHNLSSFALDTLAALGYEGMSSDDSEGEIGKRDRRFHIKILPWRNEELTRWLHMLDSMHNNTTRSAKLPVGRPVVCTRTPSTKISFRRTAPRGLPRSFYDPLWISLQCSGKLWSLHIQPAALPLEMLSKEMCCLVS